MMLYLDTSALVKAYVTEAFTVEILATLKAVDVVASHFIAFVEVHATFARLLIARAADLAEAFALRAYDSVHLAAAESLQKSIGQPIQFACFDHKLNQAAKVLGMELIEIKK